MDRHYFFLLGLFAFCSAELDDDLEVSNKTGTLINVADDTQKALPHLNEFLRKKNMANVSLPDVKIKEKDILREVTFQGLDNMTTVVAAMATVIPPGTLNVTNVVDLGKTKLSAKDVATNSDVVWDIDGLVLIIDFTHMPPESKDAECSIKFSKVKIMNVVNVVQHSSNDKLDDKTPEKEMVKNVMDFYNHYLQDPKVLAKLNTSLDLCDSSLLDALNLKD